MPPVVAASTASAAAAPPAPPQSVFLSAFNVEHAATVQPGTLQVDLGGFEGADLGELSARKLVIGSRGGVVSLRRSAGYPSVVAAVSAADTACTFLVDCDDPALAVPDLSPSPAPTAVTAWTSLIHGYIRDKSSRRRFDIASIVAKRREGDCSEHAVLLTGVLRRAHVPSHVVIGFVLVDIAGQTRAFGHAWSEYHDGRAWQLADASNPPALVARFSYVPLQIMRNEGPGFALQMLSALNVAHVQRVVLPLAE
ncbi:MAG TPA: transglutaminase-like domain-containing protein [Polyangiaceae bacterium]|nr:transglutaminase-like domain-containing protein [Polyangiaceae bacterium]